MLCADFKMDCIIVNGLLALSRLALMSFIVHAQKTAKLSSSIPSSGLSFIVIG